MQIEVDFNFVNCRGNVNRSRHERYTSAPPGSGFKLVHGTPLGELLFYHAPTPPLDLSVATPEEADTLLDTDCAVEVSLTLH